MLSTNFLRAALARGFASKTLKSYSFDEIKTLVKEPNPSKVLVDVREPAELKQYTLPNSINLPLKTYPGALSLPPNEFQEIFGMEKPSTEKELIFFCAGGMRAQAAQELASSYGYENTSVWPGSINEWLAKGGDKL
ncbi:HBL348Wp [Eremothecium sinecaudum]|uniref:HBL348Wp n=1 Tax=Eremothecium sinecaudum TaxID=45286 RepID=A0A120K0P4_9SACH|nr:HBL348Wp [Eremothecium sinecaudum]AMD18554.1 HBL348Wp [Eremothecium sinecaudum]